MVYISIEEINIYKNDSIKTVEQIKINDLYSYLNNLSQELNINYLKDLERITYKDDPRPLKDIQDLIKIYYKYDKKQIVIVLTYLDKYIYITIRGLTKKTYYDAKNDIITIFDKI